MTEYTLKIDWNKLTAAEIAAIQLVGVITKAPLYLQLDAARAGENLAGEEAYEAEFKRLAQAIAD